MMLYVGLIIRSFINKGKMIMKKIIVSVLVAMFFIVANPGGILAAETPDFDAVYYAQRYPNVANTVGCDEKALLNHYMTVGVKEGMYPNALAECAAREKEIALQNAKATGNTALAEELSKAQAKAAATANTLSGTAGNQSAVVPVTALSTVQSASSIPAQTVLPLNPMIGTYVDVDITNQTMTLFVNNIPMLTSPCVTGTLKDKRSTPTGAFYIMEKKPGKRLKGDTWDVWVDRWMKFTSDSCGLHDASWRRKFGGSIYKSNGSHGCVNLPTDVAYQLYDMVTVGTPVIVH